MKPRRAFQAEFGSYVAVGCPDLNRTVPKNGLNVLGVLMVLGAIVKIIGKIVKRLDK